MRVEKVSKDDIEDLKNIAKEAILESVVASDVIKSEIITDTISHIEKGVSSPDNVFLKCTDSFILGFILVQGYWNLSDLFVIPNSHNKGVGRLLFSAAKAECLPKQEKGYIRVNSSINAESFYRSMGFISFTPKKEVPSFVVPLIYNF